MVGRSRNPSDTELRETPLAVAAVAAVEVSTAVGSGEFSTVSTDIEVPTATELGTEVPTAVEGGSCW